MTVLERWRRRKDQRKTSLGRQPSLRKGRNGWPLLKRKEASFRLTDFRVRNPIERHLQQESMGRFNVEALVLRAIKVEVIDLLRDAGGSCTVLAMANAVSGSPRVQECVGDAADSENDAWGLAFLDLIPGRAARKKSNARLAKRYEFINALHKLEASPSSSEARISSWEEALEKLRTVLNTQFAEADGSDGLSIPDDLLEESIVDKYLLRAQAIKLQQMEELEHSQNQWLQISNAALSQRISQVDANQLDEADRLMRARLDAEYEKREKRLQSTSLAEFEAKLIQEERNREARERALSLMRPLEDAELKIVHEAMSHVGNPNEIVAQAGVDSVQRESFQRLAPAQWLNDEVIHYFYVMLANRDEELCKADPNRKRCHFFKSFFITKLLDEEHSNPSLRGKYNYNNVKRWSKKVPGKDIFNLDKIFFPINVSRMHWVCAVVFMQQKKVQFYDSMGDGGMYHLKAIFRYIQDEHQAKEGAPLPDADAWTLVPCLSDTPRQKNGT
jgi:sentrin-specific protease 1